MRELKFRVWSIEHKNWDNPSILEVWNDSGKLEPFQYIKTGHLNPIYMPLENYIIQQFTGLTDTDNTEIYEGDIVKCEFANQPGQNTGIVEYSNKYGSFGVRIVKGDVHVFAREVPKPFMNFMIGSEQKLLVTVISNIFENKDL